MPLRYVCSTTCPGCCVITEPSWTG